MTIILTIYTQVIVCRSLKSSFSLDVSNSAQTFTEDWAYSSQETQLPLTRIHRWSAIAGSAMAMLDMSSDVCQLSAEEESILTSFTRRFSKIAAVADARGSTSAVDVLNTMLVPAIALDRRGFVANVTAAAHALFDDDIKIKDKRLFVRNLEARAVLKAALDQLTSPVKSLLADSWTIVQRRDKSLVILRICPVEGAAHSPEQESLVTLNLLGPSQALRLRHDPRFMSNGSAWSSV